MMLYFQHENGNLYRIEFDIIKTAVTGSGTSFTCQIQHNGISLKEITGDSVASVTASANTWIASFATKMKDGSGGSEIIIVIDDF